VSGRPTPVVVAVDDTGSSDDAVEWAAAEAAAQQCPLRLVHCVRPVPPDDPYGLALPGVAVQLPPMSAELVLVEALDRARRVAPEVPASAWPLTAPLVPALLAEAERARLLVLGGRGHGRLRQLLTGSVPVRMAARAACPVVVVHARADGADGDDDSDDAVAAPPRVVVGVDGSPWGAPAVGFAFRAARQRGIPLTALHAWAPHPPADLDAAPVPRDAAEALARRVLDRALEPWRPAFPDVAVRAELVPARPGTALVAGSRGAALLVLGSRGRGPVLGALLGSVGHAALHRARVPLAVVRRDCVLAAHPS
jgi:nucleotide-binding universal stress UspA family protein